MNAMDVQIGRSDSDPPWYYRILLPLDFGRLPLQSKKHNYHDSKLMSHTSFDRGGIKLNPFGRN